MVTTTLILSFAELNILTVTNVSITGNVNLCYNNDILRCIFPQASAAAAVSPGRGLSIPPGYVRTRIYVYMRFRSRYMRTWCLSSTETVDGHVTYAHEQENQKSNKLFLNIFLFIFCFEQICVFHSSVKYPICTQICVFRCSHTQWLIGVKITTIKLSNISN